MYEFTIDGQAVTREELFIKMQSLMLQYDEIADDLSELFETGSITIENTVFQIKEANI